MSTISASTTTTTAYKVTADTTGTLVFQTGGTPTTAVTIGSDQSATFAGAVNTTGNQTITGSLTTTGYANLPNTFGFKNRIINGGMVIDQRNAGASVTPAADAYTIDRWVAQMSQASKLTFQQTPSATETGYATRVAAGFQNYLAVTTASAFSVGSTDYFNACQRIEGYNIADLAWGTANAATVTLSFWVRSSLTGTFGGTLMNNAGTQSYPFTYTINAANTWEYKTAVIPGSTTGTWLTTSGRGIQVQFGLGAGSSASAAAGSWAAGAYYSATGSTSVVGTAGATWYVTGVQLEKGSTATSFDFRSYGTELALCQRYAYIFNGAFNGNRAYNQYGTGNYISATQAVIIIQHPVPMRSNASMAFTNITSAQLDGTACTSITIDIGSPTSISIIPVVASGKTSGNGARFYDGGSGTTSLLVTAEL